MEVPFLDLKIQYESISDDITNAIQSVIDDTAFAGGAYVQSFEDDFAKYCKTSYAIGVSSGTSALWLALKAFGIGQNDEVITTPNTFIATAEAISFCGAKPVFVDIDPQTYNINPELIEAAITPKTKAIIPVHLYGQAADMDPILEIAGRHGLTVIEDASQAHGATYKGRPVGSLGDAGCFSFYPGKNLGAYGEAGAVVTNSDEAASKIRMLRDHGQSSKYYHEVVGWNARMDGIQGAILQAKLKKLRVWNDARRKNAAYYHRILSNIPDIILPLESYYGEHVYHIYAIRVKNRNHFREYLEERGVHTGIHYPVPLHLQNAYRSLSLGKGSFPVTEQCADELISLPMYPELNSKQLEYIAEMIRDYSEKTVELI